MNSFEELINKYCPNGVRFYYAKDIVLLNNYKQLGAEELEMLRVDGGDIPLLPSSRNYDWFTTREVANEYICEGEIFTMGRARNANTKYANGPFVSSNNIIIESANIDLVLTRFLFHFFTSKISEFYIETSTYPKFDTNLFKNLRVPVPPIEIQRYIVETLDYFCSLNECLNDEQSKRETQLNYYRNKLLSFDDTVKRIELGKACSIKGRVGWQSLTKAEYRTQGDYFLVTGTDFTRYNKVDFEHCYYVSKERYDQDPYIQLKIGDVLLTKDGTIGKVVYIDHLPKPATLNSHLVVFRDLTGKIMPRFLMHMLLSEHFIKFAESKSSKGTIIGLPQNVIASFPMPIPPLDEQKRIVAILDDLSLLCLDPKLGIPSEIALREKQFNYYRNKLLTFKEAK